MTALEHPADVIVVATGFWTTEQPIAERIVGREGRTLAEEWAEGGMSAYKGTTVHGFPNLFTIGGPNTAQGHTSVVFVIESQVAYICDALRTMRQRGYAAVEPRAGIQRRYNASLQRRMRAHRVEPRRLHVVVPGRPRPDHHALAAVDVHPATDPGPLRRRRLRRGSLSGRMAAWRSSSVTPSASR